MGAIMCFIAWGLSRPGRGGSWLMVEDFIVVGGMGIQHFPFSRNGGAADRREQPQGNECPREGRGSPLLPPAQFSMAWSSCRSEFALRMTTRRHRIAEKALYGRYGQ